MCDCRNTFDECAFENVGPKQNRRRISFLIILESKFRNIAVGLYSVGSFVMKKGLVFFVFLVKAKTHWIMLAGTIKTQKN